MPSWDGQGSHLDLSDGAGGGPAEPAPALPKSSDPIPIGRNVLRAVNGGNEQTTTDRIIYYADPGLATSFDADDAAEELSSASLSETVRPIPHGSVNSALEGDSFREADLFGQSDSSSDLRYQLAADDHSDWSYGRGFSSSGDW